MIHKSIEVVYNILDIPGIPSAGVTTESIDFRNEAMDLLESALKSTRAGNWLGAEITIDQISIRFRVQDFDAAERIVRQSVANTPYAIIHAIQRAELESDIEDLDDLETTNWNVIEAEQDDDDNEFDAVDDLLNADDIDLEDMDLDELDGDDFATDELDREAIAEGLQEMGFQDSEVLASLAALCQRLIPTDQVEPERRRDDEFSRLGGTPMVPRGFEWPRHNGRPLAFLAQADFADDDICLLFFYDVAHRVSGLAPNHQGAGRVVYINRQQLSPAQIPVDLPPTNRYPHVPATLVNDINLPDYTSQIIAESGICDEDQELLESMDRSQSEESNPAHHLFGHPSTLDGDMELGCQLVHLGYDLSNPEWIQDPRLESLDTRPEFWMLLFQCDDDPRLGWSFGESGKAGRLFFWIRDSDFDEMNFDHVMVFTQTESED
jgi:hypothetical protein